jgi:hypothetical protein
MLDVIGNVSRSSICAKENFGKGIEITREGLGVVKILSLMYGETYDADGYGVAMSVWFNPLRRKHLQLSGKTSFPSTVSGFRTG